MDHYSIYAFDKEHKITITNDSKQQLISDLNQSNFLRTRIVIAVPTYEMLDAVHDHVCRELAERTDVYVGKYITQGYLIHKYSNVKTEYEENNAPWAYAPHMDQDEINAFLSSHEWENEYKKLLSDQIFPNLCGKTVKISIMLNKLMFIPRVVGEIFDHHAHVIMFNPGINDYLDFYSTVEEQEGEWKAVVMKRPDEKCFPSKCCRFRVTHITESNLVAELIKRSYSRLGYDGVKTERVDFHDPEVPAVKLLSDEVTYKRYYGYFPILFETLNKSLWGGLAHCVGDGMASPNSFNRMAHSMGKLTGPVLVKLGEPHPHLLRNLGEQLGDSTQQIKKKLVQHYAQSVISRVEPGSPVYVVCAPRMCRWLKELPAFSDIDIVKTDKGRLEDDQVDAVADVMTNKFNELANLSKSKYAFSRWVHANGITDKDLHKLIANLLLAVTSTIQSGKDGKEAQPDFRFRKGLAHGITIPNRKSQRARLIRLCGSIVDDHASDTDRQHEIYQRYDAAVKGLMYRGKKYQKRTGKTGRHPLNGLENDVTN